MPKPLVIISSISSIVATPSIIIWQASLISGETKRAEIPPGDSDIGTIRFPNNLINFSTFLLTSSEVAIPLETSTTGASG